MTHIEIYKFLTDLGLFASLIFFAYRFTRSNPANINTTALEELQAGLRTAIREADQAGRGLNDQLTHRKQSLEKLLFDLETIESRVNRAIINAEDKKAELQSAVERTRSVYPAVQNAPVAATVFTAPQSEEIPSFSEVGTFRSPAATEDRDLLEVEAESPVMTNIFGEPITTERAAAEPQGEELKKKFIPTPLTTKIEKEISSEKIPETKPAKVSIEDTYAQAEELLKAGKAVDEICKLTQLTADEVRLLSQMLEQDAADEPVITEPQIAADERLGVLAGFKRQVQVL